MLNTRETNMVRTAQLRSLCKHYVALLHYIDMVGTYNKCTCYMNCVSILPVYDWLLVLLVVCLPVSRSSVVRSDWLVVLLVLGLPVSWTSVVCRGLLVCVFVEV